MRRVSATPRISGQSATAGIGLLSLAGRAEFHNPTLDVAVNYENLAIKLEEHFPDPEERGRVLTLLESYGAEEYEREPDRVRLAILKLAGRDPEKVEKYVHSARGDYRDVLAWAEYPNQMRVQCGLGIAAREELIRRDREQYERWLFGKTRSD